MGSNTQDACYLALLALAEEFRTMNPPNIRNCIQCLVAIFNLKQPPKVEARTHLQLGNILLQHTKNTDLALSHLEKAVSIYISYNSQNSLRYLISEFHFSVEVLIDSFDFLLVVMQI